MSIIKCKMCGGNLELFEGSTIAVCENCGCQQTVPVADDEKKLVLFERAERLRKQCEFDKAAGVYEAIVADFRQEAEGYWGLVLCRYGIEYVDDPATGKKVITCHRSSFASVQEDGDFQMTLECADPLSRRVYQEEAQQIDAIRQRIVEVSSKEEPYDVFICYKETDAFKQRTVDSVLAQDIYTNLTSQGYRVFFSRISLEDKLGSEYEPVIFAALNSAKVMLVVGTDSEYYNAVWVKNEWSRYLKLMADNHTKQLIPCYKYIDPYDLPKEFRALQAQDMGKVGAMQDLLRGIEKILPKKAAAPAAAPAAATSGDSIAPLLERAGMFLADGRWNDVRDYSNRVLDRQPKNGTAYFYILLADFKCHNIDELKIGYQVIDTHHCYNKIMTFADPQIQKAVSDCSNQIHANINRKNDLIQDSAAKKNVVNQAIESATDTINQIKNAIKRSDEDIDKCKAKASDLQGSIAATRKELENQKITGSKVVGLLFAAVMLVAVPVYVFGIIGAEIDSEFAFAFSCVFGTVCAMLFQSLYYENVWFFVKLLLGEVAAFFVLLVIVNNPFRMIEIMLDSIFGDQEEYFQPGGDITSIVVLAGLNYLIAVPSAIIAIIQVVCSKKESEKLKIKLVQEQNVLTQTVAEGGELDMLKRRLQENEAMHQRVCAESKAKVQQLYGEFKTVAEKCGVDTTISAPDWWNDAIPANQNTQSK